MKPAGSVSQGSTASPRQTLSVSIIVPCRNEVKHIRSFLECLEHQQIPEDIQVEILIADALSSDGTREVLQAAARRIPGLRVLDNHKQLVSAGLNLAISESQGEIILRMDVHSEYAPDYVEQSVRVLCETGADNVGGPARTRSSGLIQEAISLAYHSPFGCGGARFHDVDYQGYTDTVPYGCWRRTTFDQLGLFDELLARNQDDEFNLRITRSGGRIWQSSRICSWYLTRSSLAGLFKQYAQYGYWKVQVIRRHGTPASWRHPVPALFVATIACLFAAAPFIHVAAVGLVGILGLYLAAALLASLVACAKARSVRCFVILPLVFGAYHVSYGTGFLCGLFDSILKRKPHQGYSAITR